MKIIPTSPSVGLTWTEQHVFQLLQATDWAKDTVALSSVNLSENERKRWGEIDFVVLSPFGLIAIEVKGGAVSCHDGEWQYRSDRGTIRRKESPFAQASGGFFALEGLLARDASLGLSKPVLGGFCVILASMRRKDLEGIVGGPEMPAELTGSCEDLENSRSLVAFLNRVVRYWQKHSSAKGDWSSTTIQSVVRRLRPEFDRAVPLSLRLRATREERVQLTEEQYELLDQLSTEPRLLVTGGAGCGKTFLAIEFARREATCGRRVLFVCGAEALAQYLSVTAGLPENVEVVAASSLIDRKGKPIADVLVVDEGQQITNVDYALALDTCVAGGLSSGRWCWFGDYKSQISIKAPVDKSVLDELRRWALPQQIFQNCRNTPQLLAAAETLSGIRIGTARVRGAGPQLGWAVAHRRSDVAAAAAAQLSSWIIAETPPDEIVLLYASEAGRSDAIACSRKAALEPAPWGSSFAMAKRGRSVALAAIDEFRGLESEYVQIFGLDDVLSDEELRGLAYLAVTRATFAGVIACTTGIKTRMLALAVSGVS
ncbi:MAG: NERD domain-containing protein/DEAD/DEAH box helicase [Gemmatimonadaceae bacterium]|nr:NERD domain-containing protein/DEAD/DEAH box helicase [Gemmatimonadaceae bacterium]